MNSKNWKPKAVISGGWIDDLSNKVGQYISLETSDGIRREGRLSGLGTRSLKVFGKDQLIPTEVEINGDPQDRIPLDRIVTLSLLNG